MNTTTINANIAKGWKPNQYLSNMSMAYFQDGEYAARKLFPVCPVQLSSSYYYTFSKGDLARDNVQNKPMYGSVSPAVMGLADSTYACKVDQIIVGIDDIATLNYARGGATGSADPRRARVRFITEQLNLHQDILFAKNFFKKEAWANVWTGASTANSARKEFERFNNTSFNPIDFFDARITDIKKNGRRKPNKLALGVDSYNALKQNPFIMERIKYTGAAASPAMVNENVLAQLFGIDEVVVLDSTYNAAPQGQPEDMQFICDSKGALLMYTTANPQIDEPSAGYIFTWDMLGNGQYIAMDQYEGPKGTHTQMIEGMLACDMHKCADDLAIYFADCVDEV